MQALLELAPPVAFFAAYYLHGLYAATGALMAAMAAVLAVDIAVLRRIPPMHGFSAAIVFVFGAATLLLHDQRYIEWKPTVFYWLVSAAFLGSFWVGERPLVERLLGNMLGSALGSEIRLPEPLWRRLNWIWAAFAAALGALNLAVAYDASERAWVNFHVIGLTLATAVFLAVQIAWLVRRIESPARDSSAGAG